MLFSELALHERVQKALSELGFEQATPVQEQTLPLAMTGKDLMVSAETGSGKTAAFLLPMLNHMHTTPSPKTSTRGLVLVPTRELGLQVLKECEALARYTFIKAGLIVLSLSHKSYLGLSFSETNQDHDSFTSSTLV